MHVNLIGHDFYFLADSNQREKAVIMLEKYILKPEILILLMLLVIYFILFLVAKIIKNKKAFNVLEKISPWMYLLIILDVTVLNRVHGEREMRLYHDLWFTTSGFHESNVLGFLLNACLYMPLGYLLYRYIKYSKKILVTILVILLTSMLIETVQYVFARGVTAIDDFVANSVGGLIGLGFALFIQKTKETKL